MAIVDTISSMYENVGEVYDTITNVDLPTNKNIENIPSTIRKSYLDIMNNGIDTIYDNWEKVNGTGTSLTLNNTEEAPMTIEYKGNTSQGENPTPTTPQDIHIVSGDNYINVVGKNLFNIEGQYETGTGITLTKNDDGSFTLNGTANGNNFFRGLCYLNEQHTISYTSNTSNGNVIIRTRTGTPTAQTGIQDQLFASSTSGNLTSSKQFDFVEISIPSGTTLNNFKIYIQLEKGNQVTDFQPYQKESYEINLGKNLFDKSIANLNKGISTSTGNLYDDTNCFTTDFIEIETGGVYYTASGYSTVANRVYGAQYDSNKQYVGGIATNAGTKTFYISNANTKYIRLTGLSSEIDTYQLEKGSQATSFSPYFTPIELCKIGTYQDYIYKDSDKWYLHKEIGKYNEWARVNARTAYTNTTRFQFILTYPTTSAKRAYLLSNYFRNAINNDDTEHLFVGTGTPNVYDGLNVFISNSRATTSEEAINWLQTNGVAVYYALETPTTTEIIDATLISQLDAIKKSYENQTNINQENNDLPFELEVEALKKY